MSKKSTEITKHEQAIVDEMGLSASQITHYSPDKQEAEEDEVCVYRKKLGLYVCYVKEK